MVTWIGGVLAGALLIGAGLYFGLSMLQKDQPSGGAGISAVKTAPAQSAQPDAAVAKRAAPQPTAPAARPAPVPAPAPAPTQIEDTEINTATSAVSERMATDPDTVNDTQPARAQPVAPRAATTGGIAAARLPSGEEIMVPAGVRVDEYLAEKARERGIVLEEEPRPESIIEGDDAQDVTLDTDLRTQQEINEDDTVYQPRTPD